VADIAFFSDGVEVDPVEILKMEVHRARYFMNLLFQKLDGAAMRALFADEIERAATREETWMKASSGDFSESVVCARVPAGNSQEFIDWFLAGYMGPNLPGMLRAHPEHLASWPLSDGRFGILEVPGHFDVPVLLRLRPVEDVGRIGVALDEQMPHRIMGVFETEDGRALGYLVHQFSDESVGFRARLACYWPKAADERMVAGHADHLMVEFRNWFHMYLATRKQPADLLDHALKANL
jgi:hypothetical protein